MDTHHVSFRAERWGAGMRTRKGVRRGGQDGNNKGSTEVGWRTSGQVKEIETRITEAFAKVRTTDPLMLGNQTARRNLNWSDSSLSHSLLLSVCVCVCVCVCFHRDTSSNCQSSLNHLLLSKSKSKIHFFYYIDYLYDDDHSVTTDWIYSSFICRIL